MNHPAATTGKNDMARQKKFKAGDWVEIIESGEVHRVHAQDINDRLMLAGRAYSVPPSLVRKLPASPATLAKSHRLLMRYFAARDAEIASQCAGNYHARKQAMEAMERHCRRIAKGKGTKK